MRIAGDVTHVDVLQDEQGRSKCCAVVRYASPPEAHAAIGAMNGSLLQVCVSVLSTQQQHFTCATTCVLITRM
jgi:RNA recognition motif-containing protein